MSDQPPHPGDDRLLTWDLDDPATGQPIPTGAIVTLAVAAPDGTISSPPVVEVSPGRFTATYSITQAGRHVCRWTATGSVRASDPYVFIVDSHLAPLG